MSSMSDRKAELERKKAKLQALRDEKDRRRREKEQKDAEEALVRATTASSMDSRRDLDEMLSSLGVAPVKDVLSSLSSMTSLTPPQTASPDTSLPHTDKTSLPSHGGPKKPALLQVVSVQSTDIPPKENVTYAKQTQTTTTGVSELRDAHETDYYGASVTAGCTSLTVGRPCGRIPGGSLPWNASSSSPCRAPSPSNDFINEKEECKKIREINTKLEVELKEAREVVKSHRTLLLSSRDVIKNLQETVSRLVHRVKRDNKIMKDEMISRDKTIATLEKDKENLVQTHSENIAELRKAHELHIKELSIINEKKIQQVHLEADTQVAQFTCVIKELRLKQEETEEEKTEQMMARVADYEDILQLNDQLAKLREQLSRQAARTDANIDKNIYPSQFKTQVERPYSVNYDSSVDMDQALEGPSSKFTPMSTQNKAPKQNTLQVMYYDNKPQTTKLEKKGQFNITKKRKLYSDKDFQDF